MLNAPQPRSRLYTTKRHYAKGLKAVAFGYGQDLRATGQAAEDLERKLELLAPGYHATLVPMARVGIYLALKHLIRPGQKVILSPYTISEVVSMVLCAGGIPIFADVEEGGSYNIRAAKVAELLGTERDIGAVLVTHFYGLICDIEPILEVCRRKGIPVIEDAAQAFGAGRGARTAGALTDVGVYSFGVLKAVTSFLGGAVLTKDPSLAAAIRGAAAHWPLISRKFLLKKIIAGATLDLATMPWVFRSSVYWMFRYALLHDRKFFMNKLDTDRNPIAFSTLPSRYAARMSETQAEIILPQLGAYAGDIERRIALAKLYHDGLQGLPGLVLPPLRTDGSHIYTYYTIQSEERDRLSRFMTERFRDVQVSHHRNCASLPCFSQFASDCPQAEKAAQRAIYLPAYPGYEPRQVAANIDVIRAYCQGARK